jgi:hypothetical protein
MEELKYVLNEDCAKAGYRRENFGSQWAKVTLAFVKDVNGASDVDTDG